MTIPEGMRVTMADVRKAGHCPSGTRNWFNAQGLDFRDFLKNGIDALEFVERGDGLSLAIVEGMLRG